MESIQRNHGVTSLGAGPGLFEIEWETLSYSRNSSAVRVLTYARLVSFGEAKAFASKHGLSFPPKNWEQMYGGAGKVLA